MRNLRPRARVLLLFAALNGAFAPLEVLVRRARTFSRPAGPTRKNYVCRKRLRGRLRLRAVTSREHTLHYFAYLKSLI